MIIGITYSSVFQKEYNLNISIGDEAVIENDI